MPASKNAPASRLNQITRHMSSSNSVQAAPVARKQAHSPAAVAKDDDKLVKLLSEGGLRTILLNRSGNLNALNQDMVNLLDSYIDTCSRSASCNIILLRGVGRALCSGGDVLAVVQSAASNDAAVRSRSLSFFQSEYQLDYKIAKLGQVASANSAGKAAESTNKVLRSLGHDLNQTPKVFISMMDGITMGGGVGLSVHAPFRVSTERTLFAMPETGIGFFPDVGVTRVLARLDGKIGQYLGMSGARISGEEAYLIGLATHYIPSSSIDAVAHRLSTLPAEAASKPSLVSKAILEFSADPFGDDKAAILSKTPFLGDRRIALDYVFGQPSCENIFGALEEIVSGNSSTQAATELQQLGLASITPEVQEWASETLKNLKVKSPRSLKVTHQAILEARRLDVEEAFRFDMRLATAFCDLSIGRDFYEGVTHTLVKDPKTGKRKQGVANWNPASLDKVSDESVRTLFFADVEDARKAGLKMEVPQLSSIPTLPETRDARQARDAALRGKGPLQWEPTHNVFALPSEAECAALLDGSHPASGAVKLEDQELIDSLRRYKGDLVGLDVKVRDWLERNQRRRI